MNLQHVLCSSGHLRMITFGGPCAQVYPACWVCLPPGDFVVPGARLAVALICAPFAVKNLDDNVVLQYLAVIGLVVMAVAWPKSLERIGDPAVDQLSELTAQVAGDLPTAVEIFVAASPTLEFGVQTCWLLTRRSPLFFRWPGNLTSGIFATASKSQRPHRSWYSRSSLLRGQT